MHWHWIGSSKDWLLGRFPIYREMSEEPDLRWILYYRDGVPLIQWIRLTLHWHWIQWIRLTLHWYWIGSSQVWLLGRFPIYRETSEEPHLRWILYYRDRVPWIQWIRLTLHWHWISWIRLTLHWYWIGSSQVWLLGRFPIYRETSEEPHLRWILYYWDRVPWIQWIQLALHWNCIGNQLALDWFISDPANDLRSRWILTWAVSWESIDSQLVVKKHSIGFNWHFIGRLVTLRWLSNGIPLVFNWHSIGIQLAFHWNSVGIPLVVDWHSIGSQLKYHW